MDAVQQYMYGKRRYRPPYVSFFPSDQQIQATSRFRRVNLLCGVRAFFELFPAVSMLYECMLHIVSVSASASASFCVRACVHACGTTAHYDEIDTFHSLLLAKH